MPPFESDPQAMARRCRRTGHRECLRRPAAGGGFALAQCGETDFGLRRSAQGRQHGGRARVRAGRADRDCRRRRHARAGAHVGRQQHLPHLFDDQADHRHGGDAADRRGQARARPAALRDPAQVQAHAGAEGLRWPGHARQPRTGEARDHDSAAADPHRRAWLRHRPERADCRGVQGPRGGAGPRHQAAEPPGVPRHRGARARRLRRPAGRNAAGLPAGRALVVFDGCRPARAGDRGG